MAGIDEQWELGRSSGRISVTAATSADCAMGSLYQSYGFQIYASCLGICGTYISWHMHARRLDRTGLADIEHLRRTTAWSYAYEGWFRSFGK